MHHTPSLLWIKATGRVDQAVSLLYLWLCDVSPPSCGTWRLSLTVCLCHHAPPGSHWFRHMSEHTWCRPGIGKLLPRGLLIFQFWPAKMFLFSLEVSHNIAVFHTFFSCGKTKYFYLLTFSIIFNWQESMFPTCHTIYFFQPSVPALATLSNPRTCHIPSLALCLQRFVKTLYIYHRCFVEPAISLQRTPGWSCWG